MKFVQCHPDTLMVLYIPYQTSRFTEDRKGIMMLLFYHVVQLKYPLVLGSENIVIFVRSFLKYFNCGIPNKEFKTIPFVTINYIFI